MNDSSTRSFMASSMLVLMMVAVSAGACGGETFELIPKAFLGIACLIVRQSLLARLGMDADACFVRVDELRKLKIALGFSVGKSNADIQQPLERSEESAASEGR